MTGQIADVYEYNGNRYNIVAIKGTMNFDIHELGGTEIATRIPIIATTTSNSANVNPC